MNVQKQNSEHITRSEFYEKFDSFELMIKNELSHFGQTIMQDVKNLIVESFEMQKAYFDRRFDSLEHRFEESVSKNAIEHNKFESRIGILEKKV